MGIGDTTPFFTGKTHDFRYRLVSGIQISQIMWVEGSELCRNAANLYRNPWLVPPPRMLARHHQDYEPFLVGNPNLNLHLPQLLGGGTTQRSPLLPTWSLPKTFGWKVTIRNSYKISWFFKDGRNFRYTNLMWKWWHLKTIKTCLKFILD